MRLYGTQGHATKKQKSKNQNKTRQDKIKQNKTKQKRNVLAERGFDPRTSGLWAQHASTAPLCFPRSDPVNNSYFSCKYHPV